MRGWDAGEEMGREKPGEGNEIIAGVAGSEMTGEFVIWHEDRKKKKRITLRAGRGRDIYESINHILIVALAM